MDLTEVEKAVADGGGHAVLNVKELLKAAGAGRAGKLVVAEIAAALEAADYGHLPLEIPQDHSRKVLVYRLNSDQATLLLMVETARNGGENADGAIWVLGKDLTKRVESRASMEAPAPSAES